ncbi:MAG: hypothetical protein K9K76_07440 [Halanaerobiales bacterium]|nr:hypothetical protein [Halanaerobiales bacterium]
MSAKDKSHLSRFKEFMGTDKEVVIGTQNSFGTMVYFAEIRIYSIEIVEDLISLGCVENKSKLIEFPSQKILPKSLISHFIRGYFDGDGSISTNGVDNGYKISIIGTKSFLEHVKKYYGLNVKILKSNNIFELKFGGQGDIINFVDDIYQDASYKLKRKYKKSMLIRNKLSRLY